MNDLEQALRILRGSKQYNFNGTVLTVIGYYTGKRISLDLGKLDADMLEALADEYEDMVTDEVEDKFEARYDEAKAEIERRIAAVYGEEYLAAWDRYAALETAFDLSLIHI